MNWHFNSDMPIYTQLITQIKYCIVSGEFPPGSRLSAVREMAADAGVNPNTMQRAFQELEREGLVYTQRNNGRFVTEDFQVIDRAKRSIANQHVMDFVHAMEKLGYGMKEIHELLNTYVTEDNNGSCS